MNARAKNGRLSSMLIITEKKNVAINYAKALGIKTEEKNGKFENQDGSIKITWASGHLYKLKEPGDYDEKWKVWNYRELPISIKNFGIKEDQEKKRTIENIRKAIKDAKEKNEEIVVATDPDREGEVIAAFILSANGIDRKKTTRIWVKEGLNKEEIKKGLEGRKSSEEFTKIYAEGINAKKADWLLGINMSRVYSIILKGIYSAGRVQTAVLKEIYRREKKIKEFKKEPYFKLKVQMENGTFSYLINETDGENQTIFKEGELNYLKEIKERISGNLKVVNVEENRKIEAVPQLYDLAGLEMDSYRIYGISVDEVMRHAENLYNERGVLSYPRTDSRCMGDEDYQYIKELIEKYEDKRTDFYKAEVSSERIKKENRRLFNTKEKHAHHALIPSGWLGKEDSEEWKVWDLVLRRFMMQGCAENIVSHKKVILRKETLRFLAEGSETLQKGWKELSLDNLKEDQVLTLKEGEELKIKDAEIEQKWTEPPKHYNEASVIAFMKNPKGSEKNMQSLGTEATRTEIIKKLYEMKYIKVQNKHIIITEKGIKLIEEIMNNKKADHFTDAEVTSEWDRKVKEEPDEFFDGAYGQVMEMVDEMKEKMQKAGTREKITDCPFCGGNIYKGEKRFFCSNWKEKNCKYSLNIQLMGNHFTEENVRRLREEKKTPVYDGVKKDGSRCRFWIREGEGEYIIVFQESESIGKCPVCGKGEIRAKAKVYKCSESACGYFLWKETSGIRVTEERAKQLLRGEEIKVTRQKKNGERENVVIRLDKSGAIEIKR